MTTALCFNCGETKFGAWCPCGRCGVASSGDRQLDILFSDHNMSVSTLREFGTVIKRISECTDEPAIRFWVFISYLSSHPAELLSATPPPEIAERVASVLAQAQLPMIEVDLKPRPAESGPPQTTIVFPEALLREYKANNKFDMIERVQVRRRDGLVVNGVLMDLSGSVEFSFNANIEMRPEEIVAIRKAPGCLFGWILKPKWVEAE